MKILDVLAPDLDLNQRFFVEASAGCGKTFAIENVFLRLLIQEDPSFNLEELLVLTFTKEATKELKKRLKASIEQAIEELQDHSSSQRPFMRSIDEQGEKRCEEVRVKLTEVLYQFDQAQIFTLHGFCYRMLTRFFFESKLSLKKSEEDEELSLEAADRVLQDFFLYRLDSSILCPSQLEILIQSFKGDYEKFFKTCLYELSKEKTPFTRSSFKEEAFAIEKKMKLLIWPDSLHEELLDLAHHFKGTQKRSGEYKEEFTQAVKSFVELVSTSKISDSLEAFIPHASSFFSKFESHNIKLKSPPNADRFSSLIESLHQMQSFLEPFYLPDRLFLLLINQLSPFYDNYLSRFQYLTPSQILNRFRKLLQNLSISKALSKLYPAVIVDEFQDTDEIQWDILNLIFLKHHSKNHPFFLVGDPKQSIYAFRDADIYTYLKASKALGSSAKYTLNTNYRSQPDLIVALNELFEKKNPNWMSLPREKSHLAYLAVQSNAQAKKREFGDQRAAIHWMPYTMKSKVRQVPSLDYEQQYLFPFIAREIIHLVDEGQAKFSDFAILVRDRYQSSRLKEFLSKCRIPFQSTRQELLSQSSSLVYFYDVLRSTLFFKNVKIVRRLFLNPFFGQASWNPELEMHWMKELSALRILIEEKGFALFFENLMKIRIGSSTFGEELLQQEGGLEVYQDWQELSNYGALLEAQGKSFAEIVEEIHQLAKGEETFQEAPFKPNLAPQEAVHLLTLHMSKGLEFGLVFPIGLINETPQEQRTVPLLREEAKPLVPRSFCKANTELFESENNAEKLRQLYVSMTRAKERLYLPVVFGVEKKENHESPMTLFLKQLGLNSLEALQALEKAPHFSLEVLDQPLMPPFYQQKETLQLTQPQPLIVNLPTSKCHSFSSLVPGLQEKDLSLDPPRDFDAQEKSIHTLPAGPETGILFHELLESLDFQSKKVDLQAKIQNTPYESWEPVMSQHLKTMLDFSLPTLEGTVKLKELKPHQVLKEIEFLYPYRDNLSINEGVKKGDYMTGVIDLVFIHRRRVYFLDYKTNWLGPTNSHYQNIEQAFYSHSYDLQAEIYALALQKYLKAFKYSNLKLGAALYWFLRGAHLNTMQSCFLFPL